MLYATFGQLKNRQQIAHIESKQENPDYNTYD